MQWDEPKAFVFFKPVSQPSSGTLVVWWSEAHEWLKCDEREVELLCFASGADDSKRATLGISLYWVVHDSVVDSDWFYMTARMTVIDL